MHQRFRVFAIHAAAAIVATAGITVVRLDGQAPPRAPRYAITGARIVTGAGAPIDKGTLVLRNGAIEDVGASVAAPPDAMVIDGTGLTVYPGLIDMANANVVDVPAEPTPAPQPAAGRGGAPAGRGGGGGGGAEQISWADQERLKRESLLNPEIEAAEYINYESDVLRRLASAGITNVLAVPPQGLIRGQSALINVMAPPESPIISALGGYWRGYVVVQSPVAQHVTFGGRGGGAGYPGALLGTIAFVRQALYDAQWQRDARAYAAKHKDAVLTGFEPVLDALAPAIEGKMPVAFDASSEAEILRALAMAKEFKLDPIIVGAIDAGAVVDDLKAAKARVILSVNYQAAGGGGGGGRGGGGGATDTAIRVIRARQNAPKVAAALEKAGVPFAFTSLGVQNPGDFVRGVGRAMRDGGLTEDVALKALTSNAAKMAGAGERLGTIEKGKIANIVITENGLFDERMRVRHVFVAGWPVDLETAAPPATGRGGRGGGR